MFEDNAGPARQRSKARFGSFEIDFRAAELRKHGQKIRLQEQPFKILCLLLEHHGEVVTREEIRSDLWPGGTVVEFDHSINAAVKRLRDALQDSAKEPRYIETVASRGYRFIAELHPSVEQVSVAPTGDDAPVTSSAASAAEEAHPVPRRWGLWSRRPLVVVPLVLGVLALVTISAWRYRQNSPEQWVRNVALPEATRLIDAGDYPGAFPMLYQALKISPSDPALVRMRREISYPVSIRTNPPGASVYARPYGKPDSAWVYIGQSPLEKFQLPWGYFRWKIEKPGFRTLEGAGGVQNPSIDFVLEPAASVMPGMVLVPSGGIKYYSLKPSFVEDFWIDQFEVTNRQFKEFVDAGGYRDERYWREKFIKAGRMLPWKEALAEFHDATGQPGPSTWRAGAYPAGHDDDPVSGVSWYEAAAYAEYAKKKLPTLHHWLRAADQGIYSDILYFSNFDKNGPVPVGRSSGIGTFGTYDMAGNVREWCWNAMRERRYIVGGGWTDGRARYLNPDTASPFDRTPSNGFRCVRYRESAMTAQALADVEGTSRDYRTERPVSDEAYRIIRGLYSYDQAELKPATESVDETSPYWRSERISFDAAYGKQRVIALLYLPKHAKPPYQTIVYFPPGSSRLMTAIDLVELKRVEFLMKSGRALMFPVYQGTYERRSSFPAGPNGARDVTIQQCKDLQRSLDYLESRPDIAHDRIGFFGLSGTIGVIALAVEPRIKAAVLAEAGLSTSAKPPETDEINFVRHVQMPVLMLNGQYDFAYPVETNQNPMFQLLGARDQDKRHILFDSGHVGPTQMYVKDTLEWFDQHLGSVN